MKSSSWAKSPAQNRSTASSLLSLGKTLQAMHRWFEQEQKYGWHQKPSICPSCSPPCMNPMGRNVSQSCGSACPVVQSGHGYCSRSIFASACLILRSAESTASCSARFLAMGALICRTMSTGSPVCLATESTVDDATATGRLPVRLDCDIGSFFLVRIFCKTGSDGDDCRHNESEDDEEWCSYWMLHGFFPFCFPLVVFENDLRTAEECEPVGFAYFLRIVDFL